MYNENEVLKKIAEAVATFFNTASDRLSYAKGYTATVKSKNGDDYFIDINGSRHKLKTDYLLNEGDIVNVMSMQNQNGDYCLMPTKNVVAQTIVNEILDTYF